MILGWWLVPDHQLIAQDCSSEAPGSRAESISGVVRDAAGATAPGTRVTATWQDWRLDGYTLSERSRRLEAITDSLGVFRFCGVPKQLSVDVQGTRADGQSAVSSVRPGGLPIALALSKGVDGRVAPPSRDVAAVTLRGFVRDSAGARISGAQLSSTDGARAMTDERGEFELFRQASSPAVLEIRRLGYQPQTIRTTAAGTALEIVLAAVPIQLSDVTTDARLTPFESFSGFTERRRRSPGTFIDRAELERRRPQVLTDVLRSVPGMVVQTGLTRWGYQTTPSIGRTSGGMIGCGIVYFVNGHEYTPTSMGIDRDISPSQIEAIEVYKVSEVPARFLGSRARCGVVVIWTRYRAHELERGTESK